MNGGDPLYERKKFDVPSSGAVKNKEMCQTKGHGWVDFNGVCRTCHEFVGLPEEERSGGTDRG